MNFSLFPVSKTRKPRFDLVLKIIDLNNIPLVSGTSFVKYSLPSSHISTSSSTPSRTSKAAITNHTSTYDHTTLIPLRLHISKDNHLQPCILTLTVIQEYPHAGTLGKAVSEKTVLGTVELDLAEYVEESEGMGEGDGITRRYLMRDSKINSTLKVGICMRQVDGERNFIAPSLRSAPVFGGIAGIMAGEGEEDTGNMPHPSRSNERGEVHDLYRRALACSWMSQPSDLSADEVIEDILVGKGDGWGNLSPYKDNGELRHDELIGIHSKQHKRSPSAFSEKSARSGTSQLTVREATPGGGYRYGGGRGAGEKNSGVSPARNDASGGGGKFHFPQEMYMDGMQAMERVRLGHRKPVEVDEFEARDDLIAWKLPGKVL